MTAPAHFLGGAALCRYVRDRPLGLAGAFLLHFVFDAVPHFETPRLLEPWFGSGVGPVWRSMFPWYWVVSGLIAVVVWYRFAVRPPRSRAAALYLIVGGALGTLPDIIATVAPGSLVDHVNRAAHWWGWVIDGVLERGRAEPFVALAMIAVELMVTAICGWVLFRMPGGRDRGAW